jgi:hypothetical protein
VEAVLWSLKSTAAGQAARQQQQQPVKMVAAAGCQNRQQQQQTGQGYGAGQLLQMAVHTTLGT